MEKFTIKIDLSTFFDDERKFVIILVDPDWKSVSCLERRVQQIFDVEVKFTGDGFFVPSQEPIEVVKFLDILKAFIPSAAPSRKSKKSKQKHTLPIEEEQPTPQESWQKKRKYLSLDSGFTSSTPNHAKRSKQIVAHTAIGIEEPKVNNKSNEITSTSEQLDAKKKKNKSKINAPNLEVIESLNDEHTVEMETTTIAKPKRKRKTKKSSFELDKENMGDTLSDGKSTNTDELKAGRAKIASSTLLNNGSIRLTLNQTAKDCISRIEAAKSNALIDYSISEEGKAVSTTTANESKNQVVAPPVKVIFRCSLQDVPLNQPRIFQIKPSKRADKIEIREHVVINAATTADFTVCAEELRGSSQCHSVNGDLRQTTVEDELAQQLSSETFDESSVIAVDLDDEDNDESSFEESEVIELNESNETEDANPQIEIIAANNEKDFSDDFKIEKLLPFATVLEDLPIVGDIVLFKMYRLNNACAPGISNVIAGKCEYTNKRTKTMKLNIIDGHSELGCIPSKFACDLDDSTTQSKNINIKLADMIDAKVFKMS